ncbi:hypothetical protein C8R45DRAFT_994876 [Mycena sanguinolenta]|nr:hypothetical protein C8R45DRAFT_994876 [Mycena sanguinolenta]
MNLFHRNPEDSKTPSNSPPSSPSKRKVLFRSHSRGGSESGSPSNLEVAPESSPKRTPLGIANVANIFIRMRRASDQVKPRNIESSSGEDPQSHPDVLEGVTGPARKPLSHTDIFICDGAVNVVQLLRFTRSSLMELAELIGANALVDEKWDCTILRPKPGRTNRTFKVRISYTASAARSDRADPHRPVALDKAHSVPGLMTVVKRIAQS